MQPSQSNNVRYRALRQLRRFGNGPEVTDTICSFRNIG
jgi:hypothetical protein